MRMMLAASSCWMAARPGRGGGAAAAHASTSPSFSGPRVEHEDDAPRRPVAARAGRRRRAVHRRGALAAPEAADEEDRVAGPGVVRRRGTGRVEEPRVGRFALVIDRVVGQHLRAAAGQRRDAPGLHRVRVELGARLRRARVLDPGHVEPRVDAARVAGPRELAAELGDAVDEARLVLVGEAAQRGEELGAESLGGRFGVAGFGEHALPIRRRNGVPGIRGHGVRGILDDDGLLAEIELRVDRLEVLSKCNVRWRGDAARFRNRRADLQRQRLGDYFQRANGCKQQRYCRVHGRRRALARF